MTKVWGCLPGEPGAAFCSCKTGFPPARILSFGQKRWRIMNDSEQMVLIDAPVVYQGKVSEPADVRTTLQELSRLRQMPAIELARITTDNARRFFGI